MSTSNKIIIAILVLLAVALGGFGYYSANRALSGRAGEQAAKPQATYPVVVATKMLPAGMPIDKEGVQVRQYPMLQAGAYSSVDQVVGQVPQTTIGPGAPVLSSYLASALSISVENGFRAVAVRVDQVIAVGDHLRPGDFVDVFFTLPAAQSQGMGVQQQQVVAAQGRMLLPKLRVLAIGAESVTRAPPMPKSSDTVEVAGKQPQNVNRAPPTSVVLQVGIDDVAKLMVGAENGKLLLALRNPSDVAQPDLSAFPSPSPALAPSRLPVGQRNSALEVPENKAYAGLTLPGLRGDESRTPPPASPMRGQASKSRSVVEVYYGDKKRTVTY